MVASQETTTKIALPSARLSHPAVLSGSLLPPTSSVSISCLCSLTSVGGTTIIGNAYAAPFSGGGFSNYFRQPSYQASAVSAYFSLLGSNDTGLYNASGRGYPDVSAHSVQFETIVDGEVTSNTGTSCSAPTFASVIALLNDRLMTSGKPALGFLNPWLYSTGVQGFTDVVVGNNRQCDNDTGFDATPGWDPVTGWGTPDFTKLLSAVGL